MKSVSLSCRLGAIVGIVLLTVLASSLVATAPAFAQLAKKTSENRAKKQDLLLIAGLQSTLDLPFEPCSNTEACIRITSKTLVLVEYSKEKKQLIFTPLKPGETTITVRDEKGDIRLILKTVVSANNLIRRADELRELLKDIEGIQFKIMADKIVVDGEVVVVNDLNRLYSVLSDESYKGIVLNLVGVSPVGMQMLADRMQGEINLPGVKVKVFNNRFMLYGEVDNQGQQEQAINIAKAMVAGFVMPTYNLDGPRSPYEVLKQSFKDPIINKISVKPGQPPPPPKMVRITIDFVELAKDYFNSFGFSWIPSLETGGSVAFGSSTTGGVTTQGSGSLAGTIGNLFPKLNSAQNSGYARILEEQVLIAQSGVPAHFKKIYEIPIQTVNDKGQPTFNKIGVGPEIDIVPSVKKSEMIELKVDFGYKALAGQQQGGVPIITDHGYRTQLQLKGGESAALVNALSNVVSTRFNKDPPTGTQPPNPLFTLLRSKAFQKNKSQFVVFITPQVIESASGGTEDIKNKYGLKRKQ